MEKHISYPLIHIRKYQYEKQQMLTRQWEDERERQEQEERDQARQGPAKNILRTDRTSPTKPTDLTPPVYKVGIDESN